MLVHLVIVLAVWVVCGVLSTLWAMYFDRPDRSEVSWLVFYSMCGGPIFLLMGVAEQIEQIIHERRVR